MNRLVLLLFYFRIFPNPKFKLAIYIVAVFVITWCPAVFVTNLLQCLPINFAWDKSIEGGICINVQAFYRYIGLPVVMSDAAVLVLPLPMIWQLHMTTRQKLAISSVFMMGSLGLIASIVRVVIFFQKDALIDPTWTSVTLLSWTMVERGAVLIAACLPPLRPLFISFWQSIAKLGSKMHCISRTSQPSASTNEELQKPGFTSLEGNEVIRQTWEIEIVPMEIMLSPKHVQEITVV